MPPLDVPDEVEGGRAQLVERLTGQIVALALFLAHGEQPHPRVVLADDVARVHVPHDGELEKMARLGIDVGPGVDQDGIAREARQRGGDGGAVHAGEDAEHEHPDGHGRPGIARRYQGIALPGLAELGGHAERRVALAAESVGRRLGHPHHLTGVADGHGQLLRLETRDLALDGGLVADEHRGEPELAGRGDGALDHDGGTEVAAHGVHRDLHRPRFSGVEAIRPRSR